MLGDVRNVSAMVAVRSNAYGILQPAAVFGLRLNFLLLLCFGIRINERIHKNSSIHAILVPSPHRTIYKYTTA